jgi:hypothetical protein
MAPLILKSFYLFFYYFKYYYLFGRKSFTVLVIWPLLIHNSDLLLYFFPQ